MRQSGWTRGIVIAYAKTFLPQDEIVLFASQYCTPDDFKLQLENSGVNVAKHLSNGTLFIIDAQDGYQGVDVNGTFNMAMSLVQRAKKEKRRGVTWLGDMGSFFAFDKICDLIDYELDSPTKYEDSMKTVCCYHRADFARLDDSQKSTLSQHHSKSIFAQ